MFNISLFDLFLCYIILGNIMPHMSGVGEANEKKKSYNDAFEMMPTTGAMFAGMRQLSIPGNFNNS